MTNEEIVKRYLAIPDEERRRLMESLKSWREESRHRVMQTYINLMIGIVGDGLLSRSRDRELVDARAVVAYELHKKGFSECEIARAFLRSHAMIHLYIDQTSFDLKHRFKNYRTDLYKTYQEKLKEYEL